MEYCPLCFEYQLKNTNNHELTRAISNQRNIKNSGNSFNNNTHILDLSANNIVDDNSTLIVTKNYIIRSNSRLKGTKPNYGRTKQ